MNIISKGELLNLTQQIFEQAGFTEKDANHCADVLVFADVRGIDSHGVARIPGYLRLIEAGRINPNPKFKWNIRKSTTGTLDADGAIGLISASKAMERTIDMCDQFGSGWIAIKNSNHFGVASYHATLGFAKKYMGFAMTNASPLVVPAGGKQRMLGTNPICIAIPGKDGNDFILDMATSAAANGKLEIAQRSGLGIPKGWAIDKDGVETQSADALKNGGALLPLGSSDETGMHKGYGLGSWVDIFSGVLSGAAFGPWCPPFVAFLESKPNAPGQGLGHFIGCWDLDGFQNSDVIQENLKNWKESFIQSEPVNSKIPVMVPGDPEKKLQQKREKEGIPLNSNVIKTLEKICSKNHIKSPF